MIKEIKYGKIDTMYVSKDKYHEFKDDKEIQEWGEYHYRKWSKEYKRVMKESKKSVDDPIFTSIIECYLGELYRQINEYLRFDKDKENMFRYLSSFLKVVVNTAPRIPEDIVVYRLVPNKVIEKLIENNKKGEPLTEKGFMSTSLLKEFLMQDENPAVYASFTNLLKIYIPKNTRGIFADIVTDRSEKEMLIYPDGHLRMIAYPYEEAGHMIYECEYITFDL